MKSPQKSGQTPLSSFFCFDSFGSKSNKPVLRSFIYQYELLDMGSILHSYVLIILWAYVTNLENKNDLPTYSFWISNIRKIDKLPIITT